MIDLLKDLCNLDSTSGDEKSVREYIISKIDGFCDYRTDVLGNLIAYKKGKNKSCKKLMIDAHMDEVGLIITSVNEDGFLKFKTVGGIDTSVLMFRRVKINEKINGVIGGKPIHLTGKEESKRLPKADSLYIDIGVYSKKEALKFVRPGDRAVICSDFTLMGDKILSKAIDDRIGCAILIKLLTTYDKYDFYASFSVQEEIGLRGARTSAYSINQQSALIIEATTAADISGVSNENKVCLTGQGPAVSFMDKATCYDRDYYNAAINSGIKCQSKCAVAGGNNSGSVHLTREGIRTLAISVPCRYIHSASGVCNFEDCNNTLKLTKFMIDGICSGSIK